MSLKRIDLTTALRPSLLPDEVLLFVQDNVGLYEGKYKIPEYQNGHAYLTSHRICYVDNEKPRQNSVAIDLKEVERHEFYAGFLKSSPKITIVPKPSKRFSLQNKGLNGLNTPSRSATPSPLPRTESPYSRPEPPPASNATWVCTICTFSNPVPSNFDPTLASARTPLPPCLACGIKPPLAQVLKAAVAGASNRPAPSTISSSIPIRGRPVEATTGFSHSLETIPSAQLPNAPGSNDGSFQCPRCTFLNHPSLLSCELCGAPLSQEPQHSTTEPYTSREESPGPILHTFFHPSLQNLEVIKLSFRAGGGDIFHERLKNAMTQRKWLLQNAPPVPKPNRPDSFHEDGSMSSSPSGSKTVGIAGLEQRRLAMRKNNELVIGSAFEDLEALMASAKEIIALAESFASQAGTSEENALLAQSASALGLATTKDMLGSGSSSATLYLTELARNLAEFLTDDARGVLKKAGGIISLVDLWAIFNRARGGVELVSPADFVKAARLWEKLHLPVRLREFKSGVLVVQGADRTDERTIEALLKWLQELHWEGDEGIQGMEVNWDVGLWGRGVTVQHVAERFGWSLGVAVEELQMAEERGAVCREEGRGETKWWENWLVREVGEMRST